MMASARRRSSMNNTSRPRRRWARERSRGMRAMRNGRFRRGPHCVAKWRRRRKCNPTRGGRTQRLTYLRRGDAFRCGERRVSRHHRDAKGPPHVNGGLREDRGRLELAARAGKGKDEGPLLGWRRRWPRPCGRPPSQGVRGGPHHSEQNLAKMGAPSRGAWSGVVGSAPRVWVEAATASLVLSVCTAR